MKAPSSLDSMATISARDALALTSSDESQCIDPASDDAEAWECDCFQAMVDSCGGISEDCFQTLVCRSNKICSSWKQSHCSAEDTGTDSMMDSAASQSNGAAVMRRVTQKA